MKQLTLTICLISTGIYTLILPLLTFLLGYLLSISTTTTIALLYIVPISIPLTLSALWYSYARGHYKRTRTLCYLPAALLLLTYLILELI